MVESQSELFLIKTNVKQQVQWMKARFFHLFFTLLVPRYFFFKIYHKLSVRTLIASVQERLHVVVQQQIIKRRKMIVASVNMPLRCRLWKRTQSVQWRKAVDIPIFKSFAIFSIEMFGLFCTMASKTYSPTSFIF